MTDARASTVSSSNSFVPDVLASGGLGSRLELILKGAKGAGLESMRGGLITALPVRWSIISEALIVELELDDEDWFPVEVSRTLGKPPLELDSSTGVLAGSLRLRRDTGGRLLRVGLCEGLVLGGVSLGVIGTAGEYELADVFGVDMRLKGLGVEVNLLEALLMSCALAVLA